jgi:hypothetical protein
MPKFLNQYQSIINSKDARDMGFEAAKDATGRMLNDFFEEIVATIMNEGDKIYLVQWAISELSEDEQHAIKKGSEARNEGVQEEH